MYIRVCKNAVVYVMYYLTVLEISACKPVMIQLTGQEAIHSRLAFLSTQFYGLFRRHILCVIGHEPAAQFSS